jgi:hypothetical protein
MATPFAIAGVLTVLVFNLDRLHLYRQRIIGYGFPVCCVMGLASGPPSDSERAQRMEGPIARMRDLFMDSCRTVFRLCVLVIRCGQDGVRTPRRIGVRGEEIVARSTTVRRKSRDAAPGRTSLFANFPGGKVHLEDAKAEHSTGRE